MVILVVSLIILALSTWWTSSKVMRLVALQKGEE